MISFPIVKMFLPNPDDYESTTEFNSEVGSIYDYSNYADANEIQPAVKIPHSQPQSRRNIIKTSIITMQNAASSGMQYFFKVVLKL